MAARTRAVAVGRDHPRLDHTQRVVEERARRVLLREPRRMLEKLHGANVVSV